MVISIIYNLIHIYSVIILIYCVLSWFPQSRGFGILADIFKILGKIVNPYLNLFRKIIPPIGGTIDISPIIAMIALELAARLIIRLLSNIIVF